MFYEQIFQINMTNHNVLRELKLHSPAGVEPAVFTWPTIEQDVNNLKYSLFFLNFSYFQDAKKDSVFVGGDEIVKTIRLVFEGTFFYSTNQQKFIFFL